MRRKLLLLVSALVLSLWAGASAPAEAIPDCTCCYCREFPESNCWNRELQFIDHCGHNYYWVVCWSTWEPGDPC